MSEKPEQPLLEVRDLKVWFPVRAGLLRRVTDHVKAVDGVTFQVQAGTTVGLVGESGSGKSTIGKAIVRLVEPTGGEVRFRGRPVSRLNEAAFFPLRRKMQMIFQDPFNSLNPRMTVGGIVGEPLDIHFPEMARRERERRIRDLLDRVHLPAAAMNRYPHQFSGGQRQRIGIARALAVDPEFIICDESVSALDVSVQAQIVNLLQDLQEELKLTYLFIAHDLAIVQHVSDYVLVMNDGQLVEQGSADTLYRQPEHPYTRKLLDAVPGMETIVTAAERRQG